jgi:hypothetical protein
VHLFLNGGDCLRGWSMRGIVSALRLLDASLLHARHCFFPSCSRPFPTVSRPFFGCSRVAPAYKNSLSISSCCLYELLGRSSRWNWLSWYPRRSRRSHALSCGWSWNLLLREETWRFCRWGFSWWIKTLLLMGRCKKMEVLAVLMAFDIACYLSSLLCVGGCFLWLIRACN